MPVCRPLGGGLYEVRSTLTDRIARIVFSIVDGDMVLLHGFLKKSQATPKADLDLARTRLRAYRRQKT
jgi:phage-related protein